MEVFAGFLSHTDHHVGRLISFLRGPGAREHDRDARLRERRERRAAPTGTTNELQFFNNAPEPLQDSVNRSTNSAARRRLPLPVGMDMGGEHAVSPLKRETYRGGACDPFVVHSPKGITAKGELRSQYAHVLDIVPTILE